MIYVNGDSWSTWNTIDRLEEPWPMQLKNFTNHDVYNDSIGCGSNSRMFYNLCNFYQHTQTTKQSIDLVLIGLTTPQRWHLPSNRLSSWSIGPTVRNDRSGIVDETILKWYVSTVYDELEYYYQYFNTIWQIDTLCKKTIECPVVFFNSWDNDIDKFLDIFYNKSKCNKWIYEKVDDTADMFTLNYINAFDYFRNYFVNVNFVRDCWENLITDQDRIDGWHPNTVGHAKICNFVKNKINSLGIAI